MGSSKKHKDKDKKRRKRDRSTSRSRDRKHRHRKHKKHKRSREERASISLSDISDIDSDYDSQQLKVESQSGSAPFIDYNPPVLQDDEPPHKRLKTKEENAENSKLNSDISLSIEETNKVRAKLGLKPLNADSGEASSVQVPNPENGAEVNHGDFIHKPAENLRDKVEVEKLREKIAAQKEKRVIASKMSKVKKLGEENEDDSAASWVKKSRQIEKLKKEAAAKEKMLEDLDAQFGIGELVEAETSSQRKKIYNAGHLSGLRVQHDMESFSEGQTILTLKDSNILENDEDVLVNVNKEEMERVEKNLKIKRTKPNDVDYDAPEVDELGRIVRNEVLTKYDEEIGGEKKKSFLIGRGGGVSALDNLDDKKMKMMKLRKLTSLNAPEQQLANEYLTPEEISFKKVKKKRKKRKMLTADDLQPLEDYEEHLGSRSTRMAVVTNGIKDGASSLEPDHVIADSLRDLIDEDDTVASQNNDVVMDEENRDSEGEKEAIELQEALSRSRRAKLGGKTSSGRVNDPLANLSHRVSSSKDLSSMTLNLTDEFCRSLGDIPTYGLSGNRADDEAIQTSHTPAPAAKEDWDKRTAWAEVDIETAHVEIENEKSAPILEEEPDTRRGIGNALRLAMKKGYFEKGSKQNAGSTGLQHLQAKNYSIDDKNVDDDRRSGRGGGERYLGPIMDFKEKDWYKPDVKLDYVDDEGRKLNTKEAFRYLSHKFHGKGSGKNKLEKRMKKWQEESLMKAMSSSDTPLQTLEKQREKQKRIGSAYLVISGHVAQDSIDVKK